MTVQRYPYRARAWHGEELVAESDACLYDDRDGEPAVLYFPQADIDPSRLGADVGPDHGRRAGRRADALRDHGTFDPERIRVEVIDAVPGEDERDTTIKAVPNLG